MKFKLRYRWLVLPGLAVVLILLLKLPSYHFKPQTDFEPEWGITFSKIYAEELGLDWQEAYLNILDDLRVDKVRLPIYWNDIAINSEEMTWEDYDWLVNEASSRNVELVIAVGKRLPRWPECHEPKWTLTLPDDKQEELLFDFITQVIERYRKNSNITHWQIENEPLVNWFGRCKEGDLRLLLKEVELVKTLDDRPIILTDSGEMGGWSKTYDTGADILGITTYRITQNGFFGYFKYPMPPSFYHLKAKWAGINWDKIISVELQAEPWTPNKQNIVSTPIKEQFNSMNRKQFFANLDYARALEIKQAYLWGAEWWYWLKLRGDDSMWRIAEKLWE